MKKLLSIMLSILMVVTMLPMAVMPASAASEEPSEESSEPAPVCDYTYDEATNTYTVYTADGLFEVAELAYNDDSSINITLAADIVLNENLADKVTVAEDGTVSADASVRKWTPLGGRWRGQILRHL